MLSQVTLRRALNGPRPEFLRRPLSVLDRFFVSTRDRGEGSGGEQFVRPDAPESN
jgi:hypothetical protein